MFLAGKGSAGRSETDVGLIRRGTDILAVGEGSNKEGGKNVRWKEERRRYVNQNIVF